MSNVSCPENAKLIFTYKLELCITSYILRYKLTDTIPSSQVDIHYQKKPLHSLSISTSVNLPHQYLNQIGTFLKVPVEISEGA